MIGNSFNLVFYILYILFIIYLTLKLCPILYAIISIIDWFLLDNGKFTSEVPNSYKTNDQSNNPKRSVQFQTSTIKTSTSHVQTTIGNISETFTVANNLS